MLVKMSRFAPLLLACLAAAGLASGQAPQAATSVRKQTVAVLPAGYFSADAVSAARVTEAVRRQFVDRGFRVLPPETVAAASQAAGLDSEKHHPDAAILAVGRRLRVDRVVYPRLLALGAPLDAA